MVHLLWLKYVKDTRRVDAVGEDVCCWWTRNYTECSVPLHMRHLCWCPAGKEEDSAAATPKEQRHSRGNRRPGRLASLTGCFHEPRPVRWTRCASRILQKFQVGPMVVVILLAQKRVISAGRRNGQGNEWVGNDGSDWRSALLPALSGSSAIFYSKMSFGLSGNSFT